MDSAGAFHKPFVLPQEDPDFYDGFLKNYNLPELVAGPVQVQRELAEGVLKPQRALKPVVLEPGSAAPTNAPGAVPRAKPDYDRSPEIE